MARHSYPETSSRSMRLFGRAALVTIAISGCAAAVHPTTGPSPLYLLAGNRSAPMAADAAGSVASFGGYVLNGTLPTTPNSAPVYQWLTSGALPDSAVTALGKAFSVSGTPVRHAYGWVLTSSVGQVRLRDGAGGQWSFTTSANNCGLGSVDVDNAGNVASAVSCGVGVPVATSASAAPAPGIASAPSTPIVPESLARSIADPVLAALGVTGAEVVYPGPGQTQVQVDPKLDGFPTQGMATVLQVDRTSVLAAGGWLTPPTAGATYPLVTAAAAFKDLANRPMNMMAIACPLSTDPAASPAPCPSPSPISVTGGALGLSMNWDQNGVPLMVPTWFFTVADSTYPISQIAVDPSYLATPTPTDTGGANAGGGTSGSGSVSGSGGSPATIIPPGVPSAAGTAKPA